MTRYLRYVIENKEPLRIGDDSTSQQGQTSTLRHIPGSAIRGFVVNALAGKPGFEVVKGCLFSNGTRFLNAYLIFGERELIPSPQGFYENKKECGKKEIQNMFIDSNIPAGFKDASLGRYSYLEDNCIHYFDVKTGSDMKIKIHEKEKNLFRNEYILPGYRFVGYIAVEEEELGKCIKSVFRDQIILGNGRSAGMGKCLVETCDYCERIPYEEYQVKEPLLGECYMMLLSHTVMRNKEGEYCGLDIDVLEKQMGVKHLEVKNCASSTVEIKGFNRIWGGKIPSVPMYEQGSVFRLSYKGEFTVERISKLMDRGIGVRRNEGFGRVVILRDYEKIRYKQRGDEGRPNPIPGKSRKDNDVRQNTVSGKRQEDRDVLKTVARAYYRKQIEKAMNQYVVDNPLKRGNIASSQLGTIESFSTSYRYNPDEGVSSIRRHFEHAEEKEQKHNTQKERHSIKSFSNTVLKILDDDLEKTLKIQTREKNQVMGIDKSELFCPEELDSLKLQLLTMLIRYENKREREED